MTNTITWDAFTKFCNEFADIIDSVTNESIELECAVNGVDVVLEEGPKLLSTLGISFVERPEQIDYDALQDWKRNR